MAAKKKTAKKKTAKKAVSKKSSQSKALTTMEEYEKQMADDASADSARVSGGGEGQFISTSNGTFTYKDSDLGDSIEVVIVNFASENIYYDAPWDPDDPNSPACAATGYDDNDYLAPFDESPDKQCDTCEECELNVWGSADVGKGKKCKNRKRLALVHVDDIGNEDAEIAKLGIAPTSLGNFNKFIKGLDKTLKKPAYGVVTNIFFDPDDDKVLKFKPVEPISDPAAIAFIMEQRKAVEDSLVEPPDFSNYHEPVKQQRRSSKKTSKKKTSKKKTAKKGKSRFS